MQIMIKQGDYEGILYDVLIYCTWGDLNGSNLCLIHLPQSNREQAGLGMWGWNEAANKILYQKSGWIFSADIKEELRNSADSKYRLFPSYDVHILHSNRSAITTLIRD